MAHTVSRLTAVAALVAAALPNTAFAHAFLKTAKPAANTVVAASPTELRLSFSGRIVVALASVQIKDAAGAMVAAAKPVGEDDATSLLVHLDRPLPPGKYTVIWRVVSVDTHPTSGSYTISVGR